MLFSRIMTRRALFFCLAACCLTALCLGVVSEPQAGEAPMIDTQNGLVRQKTHGDLDTVWNRLLGALKTAKAPIFSVVDHKDNARGAGLDMTGARVVTFGNPAVGTSLMRAMPETALDLPLRILALESPDGVVLVWNDPAWIARRHGADPELPVVAKMDGLLRKLAAAAAD